MSDNSPSYVEKTSQIRSQYSWDWTLSESIHTKTDVGSSGGGSYDQINDAWDFGDASAGAG